jgi:hypothetical protein
MELVNVPADALCLELTIAPTAAPLGGKTQLFDITPGSSPTLTMDGLPAGPATITARAFGAACAPNPSAGSPTWVSAGSVTVTLVAGQTISAAIVLRRPGNVQVTATFDDGTLVIEPNTMNFLGVAIGSNFGATFTVTNASAAAVSLPATAISGTDAAQFTAPAVGTCVGTTTLAAGASCTLNASFVPTAAGAKIALLSVGGATAQLSGTALATPLTFTPSPLNFPNTPVGSSVSLALTATNTASVALNGMVAALGGTNPTEFALGATTCASPIPAGGSCTRIVTFTPTSTGAKSATLAAAGSLISLTGASIDSLAIAPSTINFNGVGIGASASLPFTVTNTGTTTALLSAATVSGADAAEFSIPQAGTCVGLTTLGPGASCTGSVTLTPTTVGAKSATLTVATATAPLTATALVAPLTFVPSALTFPGTTVGITASLTITVTNNATIPVNIASSKITGSNSTEFSLGTSACASPIAAGATCTRLVTFTPTSIGAKSATLSTAGTPLPLTGTGVGALTIAPNPVAFPAIAVGASASIIFTVSNNSTAAVTISAAALGGTDAAQFAVAATGTCVGLTSLAAGASCTGGVSFQPSTAGAKSATLTVGSATAAVTGTAVVGSVTLTPSPLAFPSTGVGTSASLVLTVTNSGTVTVDASSASLGGTNPTEFSLGASTCTAALAPGSACTRVVIFAPLSIGAKSATLSIAGASVSLTGTAVNPLVISPTSANFGNVGVGTASPATAFTVTNVGSVATSLPAAAITGTDATQFVLPGTGSCLGSTSLAAGASCTVNASFSPTSAGTKNATISVGNASASLIGTGVVGSFAVTPSSIAFPSTTTGSTATSTVTVTATAGVAVNVPTPTFSGSNPSEFGLSSSSCPTPLPAGSSCNMVVKFAPTSSGSKSATMSLGSASVSLTGTATALALYRINCGSGNAYSPYAADAYYNGGTQATVSNSITISGITSPAPQAVYQSERYGNSTYTFPNLTAAAQYTIRLHFAELYWSGSGKRVFNVAINGNTVLSNFDVYVSAGGNFRALLREFTATADSSGQIAVKFSTITDNATISGIEILK